MTDTGRVVVVGAGVSGLAAARELAPDHEVLVFDAGGVAADTSSRASGVISLPLEPIPDAWSSFAREAFRDLDGRGCSRSRSGRPCASSARGRSRRSRAGPTRSASTPPPN